jgi:hypothetical protein
MTIDLENVDWDAFVKRWKGIMIPDLVVRVGPEQFEDELRQFVTAIVVDELRETIEAMDAFRFTRTFAGDLRQDLTNLVRDRARQLVQAERSIAALEDRPIREKVATSDWTGTPIRVRELILNLEMKYQELKNAKE